MDMAAKQRICTVKYLTCLTSSTLGTVEALGTDLACFCCVNSFVGRERGSLLCQRKWGRSTARECEVAVLPAYSLCTEEVEVVVVVEVVGVGGSKGSLSLNLVRVLPLY